jgi:hypothetical protein
MSNKNKIEIPSLKPRNPNQQVMAAKAKSGAAGAHKDKKKALKQGDVKHKNKEYAESLQIELARQLEEGRSCATKTCECSTCSKRNTCDRSTVAEGPVMTPQGSDQKWSKVKHGGLPEGGSQEEGIGDTIKRGVKQVKRGMQGWGGAQGKPGEIVKRNKGHDDKTIKNLDLKGKIYKDVDGPAEPHSPQALQNRVVDREMKKRGLGEANDWNGPLYDPKLQKGKPSKKEVAADKASADYKKKQKAAQKEAVDPLRRRKMKESYEVWLENVLIETLAAKKK